MNRPPFDTFPHLADSRIAMRAIEPEDYPALAEITWYEGVKAQTEQAAGDVYRLMDAKYEAGEALQWAIIEKVSGRVAGVCGFYRGFANDWGEIGYVLKPDLRGRGLMKSAVHLACQTGFSLLDLRGIFAVTAPDNLPSLAVLEANGFTSTSAASTDTVRLERRP